MANFLEGNPFGDVAGGMFSGALSTIFWILIAVVVIGGMIGLGMYIRYKRKFDIIAEIRSERSGEKTSVYEDKGGILTDRKTGTKYFKLWRLRKELPVPPFFTLEKVGKKDKIRIWRKSEDELVYLLPPKIYQKAYYKRDGKLYPIHKTEMRFVESDLEWAIRRKKENKGLFDHESIFMKLMPYLPAIMGGIITIFVLYILFDSLPQILSSLKELIIELRSLQGATVTE